MQPSFGLRREKTVVDVDVSDDQKELVYKQLLREQTNLHRKMSVDQQRQAEMVINLHLFVCMFISCVTYTRYGTYKEGATSQNGMHHAGLKLSPTFAIYSVHKPQMTAVLMKVISLMFSSSFYTWGTIT